MKVLIVCGAGMVSGKEIMTLELARGLKSSSLDVHLLTSTWSNPDFSQKLEEMGLSFNRLPLGFISATLTLQCMKWTYGQLERWPELLRGYRRLLRLRQPNKVIHTNWHHLIMLLPFLRPHCDLYWVHEVFPQKRHYKALFSVLNRRLQRFIPVSLAVAQSLRGLGIPDRKIQVIHNGIADLTGPLEREQISTDPVKLGIVGQINMDKGHDDLIEAFGHISEGWPNVELHIFGRGRDAYESKLKHRVSELSLIHNVRWHGYQPNRAAIFNDIDICVVPSRSEDPLPTVAIEAANFGLPVVATRRGGLPEVVEDGITGILVPSSDPRALAEAIQRLLANPDLRLSMGLRARQRMLNHFSVDRFVNDFLLLLGPTSINKDRAALC